MGIRKGFHIFGTEEFFSREKQKSCREEEKGKGRARGRGLKKRRARSLRFAGLTQVRGVYRRLMGIMG